MSRRPNRQQRTNARLAADRARATALPEDVAHEPRVPLVGFESLYEITRSGQLYSLRARRFIKRAYKDGVYLKVQVAGETHVLAISDAVAESWAQAPGRLFRVDIPASTVVVLARDPNEAREAAAAAQQIEITDRQLAISDSEVTEIAQVLPDWTTVIPYGPEALNHSYHTVHTLLTGEGQTPAPRTSDRESLDARLRRQERERGRRS